jgi:hypothetical protein
MSELYRDIMKFQARLDCLQENAYAQTMLTVIELPRIQEAWTGDVRRVARTDRAYHLNDGLTEDSRRYPIVEFGSVILNGSVPRVDCVQIGDRSVVVLPFFNYEVYGPTIEIASDMVGHEMDIDFVDTVLPINTRMDRPLYLPVESVAFIALAA